METYKWAMILDRFSGLRPCDLAEMTDFQIERLYLHPRDKEGKLREPVLSGRKGGPEMDVEAHVQTYLGFVSSINATAPGAFSDEVIAATVKEIRRHHAGAGGAE